LGLEELISTLKKNEQKQIDDIWQQARAEADSIRKQVAEAIAKITEEHADQLASACRKSVRVIVAEAEIKARKKKLLAYQGLDEVLHATAISQLPKLREHDYENVFVQLAKELPGSQWDKIIVNPSDMDLAAKFFDKNIVQPDTAISGGLIALNAGGKIVVDNTFEKRLERQWSHILPELIKRIEEKYGESESTEKAG
jgi:vacuolar-type H+-ATPase subunit E/Vma4